MKNSKKLLKVATILLLIAMIALALVANTYAKYTSEVSGTDTAIVAKWDVSAKDSKSNAFTSGSTAIVNLFDESKVYDTNKGFTTGTVDANVKKAAENADAIIAPGTWGKFSYTISNNSDVNATYAIAYTANEAEVPLKWSLTGAVGSWKDTIQELNETGTLNMPASGSATPTEKTVYWKWDFTDNTVATRDADDTDLGTSTTDVKPNATITVTFSQVD